MGNSELKPFFKQVGHERIYWSHGKTIRQWFDGVVGSEGGKVDSISLLGRSPEPDGQISVFEMKQLGIRYVVSVLENNQGLLQYMRIDQDSELGILRYGISLGGIEGKYFWYQTVPAILPNGTLDEEIQLLLEPWSLWEQKG